MKTKAIASAIALAAGLAFTACEKEDGGIAALPVSDITAESDYGAVILKWTIPDDTTFYYVDVAWTDAQGNPRRLQSSRYAADTTTTREVQVVCDGFTDTRTYTFTLTPYSITDNAGTPQTVQGTPLAAPLTSVGASLNITADFGGVMLTWENTSGKAVWVEVEYVADSMKSTKTFNAGTTGSAQVLTTATEYTVRARDKYMHYTEAKTFTVTPYAEAKFDKSAWSVPDYSADAYTSRGYSSQEAGGEGDPPAGRVVAVFDNNNATFYHAAWAEGDYTYPHWFIIDLGKEVTISRIEMTGRSGNGGEQKGQTFYTCAAADADLTAASYADSWPWADQGHYTFDPANNSAQSCRLTNNPKARYIKVYFGEADKGSGNYAMLAEMTVYGQE